MRQGTERIVKRLYKIRYTASIEGNKEAKCWDGYSFWWKDAQQMARRFPLLRDFASVPSRSPLGTLRRRGEQPWRLSIAASFLHIRQAEKKVNAANTGYMYLYAKSRYLPELTFNSANQRATLTLNQKVFFPGLGRKGDTISIGPEEYKLMQSTRDYFKGALERKVSINSYNPLG